MIFFNAHQQQPVKIIARIPKYPQLPPVKLYVMDNFRLDLYAGLSFLGKDFKAMHLLRLKTTKTST